MIADYLVTSLLTFVESLAFLQENLTFADLKATLRNRVSTRNVCHPTKRYIETRFLTPNAIAPYSESEQRSHSPCMVAS